jgi:hypothetical protein
MCARPALPHRQACHSSGNTCCQVPAAAVQPRVQGKAAILSGKSKGALVCRLPSGLKGACFSISCITSIRAAIYVVTKRLRRDRSNRGASRRSASGQQAGESCRCVHERRQNAHSRAAAAAPLPRPRRLHSSRRAPLRSASPRRRCMLWLRCSDDTSLHVALCTENVSPRPVVALCWQLAAARSLCQRHAPPAFICCAAPPHPQGPGSAHLPAVARL